MSAGPAQHAEFVRRATEILRASADGVTARNVRTRMEADMGLPPNALQAMREEVDAAIVEALKALHGEGAGGEADAEVAARLAGASGAAEAEALLKGVDDAAAAGGDGAWDEAACASALRLVESGATSAAGAAVLLDARLAGRLAPFLAPTAPPRLASLAVRALTAASMHDGTTARLLADGCLPPLLARLPTAPDSLAILLVALLNNLADSDGNRLRLLTAGALSLLTHLVIDPAGSATLKEQCVNAAAAIGGQPDAEVSFPQLVGALCASRIPGTQREAVRSAAIMAARAELLPGLARVPGLVDSLRAAESSRDAAAAAGAAEVLGALRPHL